MVSLLAFLISACVAMTLDDSVAFLAAVPDALAGGVLTAGGSSGADSDTGPYSGVVDLLSDSGTESTYCKLTAARSLLTGLAFPPLGVAFFAGGQNDDGYSSYVDVVPLSSSSSSCDLTQTSCVILSEARASLTSAATPNSAYFIGGINDNGYSNKVDRFDYTSQAWSNYPMRLARYGHASVSMGYDVYIAGGYVDPAADPVSLVTVMRENPTTGDISYLEPFELSAGNRTNLVGTSMNTSGIAAIFFGGGEGPSCGCEIGWMCTQDFSYCASLLVDVINVTADGIQKSWQFMGSMEARSRMAAVTVGTKAFFAGGKNLTGWSSMIDIYDAATGIWTQDALSVPRGNLAAAVSGNLIYFAGGLTDSGPTNVVDIYDASSGTWVNSPSPSSTPIANKK